MYFNNQFMDFICPLFLYHLKTIVLLCLIFILAWAPKKDFSPADVNEHLLPEPAEAKVNWWRMKFIKQNVHDPSEEERGPSYDDHHADLAGGHHVGVPIDVNQLHLILNIDHSRDGQPSRVKIALKYRTSPSRAWLRLNALQVLACFLACLLSACLPACLLS